MRRDQEKDFATAASAILAGCRSRINPDREKYTLENCPVCAQRFDDVPNVGVEKRFMGKA
jgi:hypothetical protein